MALPAGWRHPALKPETEKTQSASRGLRLLWLYGLGGGLLAALVLRLWPGSRHLLADLPVFWECPVLAWSGRLCMGCGATRSLGSLLAGDLATALRQNLLLAPLLALGLWQGTARMLRGTSQDPDQPAALRRLRAIFPVVPFSRRAGGALLALALVYMIVRNLDWPAAALLRP